MPLSTAYGRVRGMITVEGLTKTYGGFRAVDDVSFVAQPGRVTGFLGPNGSGKTSLLKVLLGQNHLTSGTATIGGEPVRHGQAGVGYVPQQRSIDDGLPLRGRDLVGLGWDGHVWGMGIRGMRERKRIVEDALDQVGAAVGVEVGTVEGTVGGVQVLDRPG